MISIQQKPGCAGMIVPCYRILSEDIEDRSNVMESISPKSSNCLDSVFLTIEYINGHHAAFDKQGFEQLGHGADFIRLLIDFARFSSYRLSWANARPGELL